MRESGNADVDADINLGGSPISDPFAGMPAPNPGSYPVRSTSQMKVKDTNTVLLPGVYEGGIHISGNAVVTMEPGVYYMDGGGFDVSGNADIVAEGVMLYNASSGDVRITGNGVIDWTPPESGPYAGFCVFYERTLDEPFHISGNGNMQITGTIYAASGQAELSGNGVTDILGGGYVVDTMRISGNGGLGIGHPDATPIDTGSRPFLVR
jgi:hypothetical protein